MDMTRFFLTKCKQRPVCAKRTLIWNCAQTSSQTFGRCFLNDLDVLDSAGIYNVEGFIFGTQDKLLHR